MSLRTVSPFPRSSTPIQCTTAADNTALAAATTANAELYAAVIADSKNSLTNSLPFVCPTSPTSLSSISSPTLSTIKSNPSTPYSSAFQHSHLLPSSSSVSSISSSSSSSGLCSSSTISSPTVSPPSVSKSSEAEAALSIALAMGSKTSHSGPPSAWSLSGTLFSLVLLIVWMISSILSTLTNKTLMDVFPYPVTLSLIHLFSSVVVDLLIISWRGLSLRPFRKDLFYKCLPVAATIDFQKTFTYVSYGMVPASLTHTAKASSPVFSVMLSKLMYNRVPTAAICGSLVPITIGVILSAITEINFVFFGFVAAVLASLASVLNSIYTKAALTHSSCPDPLILHLYTCVIAVFMLLPYALFKDAAPILQNILESSSMSPSASPAILSQAVTMSVDASIADAAPLLDGTQAHAAFPTDMILFSLTMHYLQNISSVYYLNGVTVLTHQVAQTLKRLVVIVSTVFYFSNPVSALNGVGMTLAIIGFFLYGLAKSKPAREPKHSTEHAVDDQVIVAHSTDGTTRMRHAHHGQDKTMHAADDGVAIKIAHDREHANGSHYVHHAIDLNALRAPIPEKDKLINVLVNGRQTPQDEAAFLL